MVVEGVEEHHRLRCSAMAQALVITMIATTSRSERLGCTVHTVRKKWRREHWKIFSDSHCASSFRQEMLEYCRTGSPVVVVGGDVRSDGSSRWNESGSTCGC